MADPVIRRSGPRGAVAGLFLALASLLAAAAPTTPPASAAAASTTRSVRRFPIPTAGARPYRIATGLDGSLWFTESDGNKVGRITTDGSISEFPVPFADSGPRGITVGPDGALWFTQYTGDLIGRIDDTGAIEEFPIPDGFALASGIAAAPDGTIWFTESSENSQLGILFPPLGYTEEIPLQQNSAPTFIAAGPDGAMWFTLEGAGQIGRVDIATRAVTYYDIPTPNALPWDITAGPDGAMWFTELAGRHVGRISMDGSITEFDVPGTYGGITGITPAFDGTLWVVQSDEREIDQISTSGQVLQQIPTGPQPNHITAGPDGNIWFTEIASSSNDIVRIGVPHDGSASVVSYDAGFVNPTVVARLGSQLNWLFEGPNAHAVQSRPAIVQSGPRNVGSVFSTAAAYAGSYRYSDPQYPSLVGTFAVPVDAPATATQGSPFPVTWGTGTPPARTRFDAQVRVPGSSQWAVWDYNVLMRRDQYTASAAGAYSFRTRIRNTASGEHSGWSPPVTVQVQPR